MKCVITNCKEEADREFLIGTQPVNVCYKHYYVLMHTFATGGTE